MTYCRIILTLRADARADWVTKFEGPVYEPIPIRSPVSRVQLYDPLSLEKFYTRKTTDNIPGRERLDPARVG